MVGGCRWLVVDRCCCSLFVVCCCLLYVVSCCCLRLRVFISGFVCVGCFPSSKFGCCLCFFCSLCVVCCCVLVVVARV